MPVLNRPDLVISQGGIKRKLDGSKPFLLILSRDQARELCKQLEGNGCTADNFSYGCVTIWPFDFCDTPTNAPPLAWDAALPGTRATCPTCAGPLNQEGQCEKAPAGWNLEKDGTFTLKGK